jgi:hypothetical protein
MFYFNLVFRQYIHFGTFLIIDVINSKVEFWVLHEEKGGCTHNTWGITRRGETRWGC